MKPTMEILDSHIVKLVTIKGDVPDANSAYKQKLEVTIELLIRIQTLREMALKDQPQFNLNGSFGASSD